MTTTRLSLLRARRVWMPVICLVLTAARLSAQELDLDFLGELQNGSPQAIERARYLEARDYLMREAAKAGFDAGTREQMRDAERRAAQVLKAVQQKEIEAFKSHHNFPPASSFFEGRETIERSQVFRILKRMPKGGALHVHSTAAGSASTLVEAAFRPECHVEVVDAREAQPRLTGRVVYLAPGSAVPDRYLPAATARERLGEAAFRTALRAAFVMEPADEHDPQLWHRFASCFSPLWDAQKYVPVFDAYFMDAFHRLARDNVDYVELRTNILPLYELDGLEQPNIERLHMLRDRVRREIPGFDFKVIIATWRGKAARGQSSGDRQESVRKTFRKAMELRSRYKDFVAGFDLVGREDTGGSTEDFLDIWLDMPVYRKEFGVDMPLYFHDGETDWTDNHNLLDAYLVGSTRIGHGLNLPLFPVLEKRFRERGIALEVCPLSNQILGFVRDLRTHPANGLIRRGVPVVLSCDDPAIFDYEGLTYDFWTACMAWELELPALKQLALNSILYSARSPAEKEAAVRAWLKKWDLWVAQLARNELP